MTNEPSLWESIGPYVEDRFEANGGVRLRESADELHKYFSLTGLTDRPLAMISANIDLLWHELVLVTEVYAPLCEKFYGELIHHRPRTDALPVPETAVRDFVDLYEDVYGDLPALWTQGTAPEILAYARRKSDHIPAFVRWSGWPGRL